MSAKDNGLRRRDILKGSGAALGAAALAAVPFPAPAQAKRTEIIFASAPFFSNDMIERLLDLYNSSQEAVTATYMQLPSAADSATLHNTLIKRLKSGKGAPDVFSLDVVRIADFATAGLAAPLGGTFGNDTLSAFFPGMVQACIVNGELVAMPWFADCGMLFYRKDILAKIGAGVPETWDDLVAAAKKGKGKGYGYLWQGKKSEALVCNLVSAIGSNGGSILGPDGSVRIADPEAVEAVKFLYDTMNGSRISPKDVVKWDEEPSRKPFHEGKAVFLRNWSYTWGLAQQGGSPIAGKIGVAPLPHFAGKKSAACLGGFQYAVNASSKKKKAALDFLGWLSGPKAQLYFATAAGLAPTRRSVFDNPAISEKQPFLAQLKGVFVGALARPVTPRYPKLSKIIQDEVSKGLKSGDIDGALNSARKKMEAALA